MDFYERVAIIDKLAQEWLKRNGKENAKPGELMEFLISNGVYTYDTRNGKPLRDDLRRLKEKDCLNLIRGLVAEQKNVNTYWYFTRV